MGVSKLSGSSAVDKALGMAAVDKALRMKLENEHVQVGDQFDDATASNPITTDNVRMYLRGISDNSSDEIDALISGDLRGLREQLTTDVNRIEQEIVEYATLNQSILKLAEAVSEGVAQVKTTQPH